MKRQPASGGMGEVYRVTDTKLGSTVAIKILPPQYAALNSFQPLQAISLLLALPIRPPFSLDCKAKPPAGSNRNFSLGRNNFFGANPVASALGNHAGRDPQFGCASIQLGFSTNPLSRNFLLVLGGDTLKRPPRSRRDSDTLAVRMTQSVCGNCTRKNRSCRCTVRVEQ